MEAALSPDTSISSSALKDGGRTYPWNVGNLFCSEDGGSIFRLDLEDLYYISRRHIPQDATRVLTAVLPQVAPKGPESHNATGRQWNCPESRDDKAYSVQFLPFHLHGNFGTTFWIAWMPLCGLPMTSVEPGRRSNAIWGARALPWHIVWRQVTERTGKHARGLP
jgi:hypothetical protein